MHDVNKNYMSIAASVRGTSCVARNNGGVARQENNPQSATTYICIRCWLNLFCCGVSSFF